MIAAKNIQLSKVAAAQRLLDAWRDRPFVWGKADCAMMVAEHLRALGHKPRYSRAGHYSTELGAIRRLKALGYGDLSAWMNDVGLMSIAPARAMAGDILGFSVDGGPFLSLAVALGNGRILGARQDMDRFWVSEVNFAAPGVVTLAWNV